MSKLCVTVTGPTMADLRKRRDAVADADLVELRVDTVADPSAAGALAGRRTPVIFTCRPSWEGGQFTGSEEERRRLLGEARQLGAEYIDVEWQAGFTELFDRGHSHGVVLSMHDFDGVPADLEARAAAMRATGAEVIKVAVMAHRLSDCLPLLTLGRASKHPMALVAMGDAGVPSRILAARFGSCWSYAGDGIAPGQLSFTRLRDEYSFRTVTDQTAVYGVVGRPVMHSVSPAMHNAAFKAARIDAAYVPLAAADFDDFLVLARALGLAGASVTAPFKVEAFEHVADSDAISRRIQSVNTLRWASNRWLGLNSDVAGVLEPLHARMAVHGARVTILGAGGAARAAAVALSSAGADVTISARRRSRADETAALVGCTAGDWPPVPHSWDILLNATPVGTAPDVDKSPLPGGPFTGQLVYDLVYNPEDTRLLREAQAAGCRTLGGLAMLVAQAQRQFEWWTGIKPSERVMREAAVRALQGALGASGASGASGAGASSD